MSPTTALAARDEVLTRRGGIELISPQAPAWLWAATAWLRSQRAMPCTWRVAK